MGCLSSIESACERESGGSESGWAVAGGMLSGSCSLLSAGECLVVATGSICTAKADSLTTLGPVVLVLPLLKFTL
jgi:hypothetical protein